MRNQCGVIVSQEHTMVLNEVKQVRDLLEIRGYVGVVAQKMGIVELYVDSVLNAPRGGVQLTLTFTLCPTDTARNHQQESNQDMKPAHRVNGSQEFHGKSPESLKDDGWR